MENTAKIPVIGVVQVLQMLKDGKTREEIRVHYGITKTDLGLLFKHKDLIGKKTIKPKAPTFTIVDDEAPVAAAAEVVEEEKVAPRTMEVVDDAPETVGDGDGSQVGDEDAHTSTEETREGKDQEAAKSTWD